MFILFGWGSKTMTWNIQVNEVPKVLTCIYSYFHIFFIPIGNTYSHKLCTIDGTFDRDITKKELKDLFGKKYPNANFFERFGLITAIVFIILLSMVSSIFFPHKNQPVTTTNSTDYSYAGVSSTDSKELMQANHTLGTVYTLENVKALSKYNLLSVEIIEDATLNTDDSVFSCLIANESENNKKYFNALRPAILDFPDIQNSYKNHKDELTKLFGSELSLVDYYRNALNVKSKQKQNNDKTGYIAKSKGETLEVLVDKDGKMTEFRIQPKLVSSDQAQS